ncbi:MAG: GNAT family N-acetyltransferase [Promethearchaeota archaeon]
MKKKKKIYQLIINLMNSWPAKYYFFHKGWILRFTNGVTSRANSVLPLNYYGNRRTLNRDITIVEEAYKMYNLPAIFTMHDFHKPKYLRNELISKNYREISHTVALGGRLNDINIENLNKNYKYFFLEMRHGDFSEFLSRQSQKSEEEQNIINKITQRIKILKKCFLVVKSQSSIVGTLAGVLDLNGYLYLVDIFVDPNFRKQSIAKSMFFKIMHDWVNPRNIKMVWLQVEIENETAISLYENIGLKKLYNYYYLINS